MNKIDSAIEEGFKAVDNLTAKPAGCKHCDQPAEWRWRDADGNESSDICQRCMETLDGYMYAPLWQFEVIPSLK